MHITAVCTGCGTRYQVSPTLRGQQMRCPRPECRTVFVVLGDAAPPPAPPPPPPATPKKQGSGSVGDFIQILSAEAVTPAVPEPPPSRGQHVSDIVPLIAAEAATPTWKDAPPPRRTTPKPSAPAPAPRPAEVAPLAAAGPVELPPGQWEPPPVRRGTEEEKAVVAEVVALQLEEHSTASSKKRKAHWLIAALSVAMLLLVCGGGLFAWYVLRDTEDKLVQLAQADYQAKKFGSAATRYQELTDKFATSSRHDDYVYLKQLSELRNRLTLSPTAVAGFDELTSFAAEHKDEPFFKQHAREFGDAVAGSVQSYTDAPAIDDGTLDVVEKAQKLLAQTKELLGNEALPPESDAKLNQSFVAILQQHADWQYRAEVVKHLEQLKEKPSADTFRAATRYVKTANLRLPGVAQTPEVTSLLDQLIDAHLASIVYRDARDLPPQPATPAAREELQPSIVVESLLRGSGSLAKGKLVLALARGVLYALDRGNGAMVWAMRVGIDTTVPPVRVPAAAGIPELILVLSSDTQTLTALDAENEGKEVWRYRLTSPCLGKPVVVEQRAFLPTYDGQVHEIHLLDGRLLGRYQLGQRLTRGGVREGKSPRVYFPADDACVYVLNVAEKRCEAILYSDHPADSLRGEPLIVGTQDAPNARPGWLILNQTQPLDAVQLRVFELPVKPHVTGELTLPFPPRLPGWTWFPPRQDGEKLALLTDAGELGLYGIRQERNRDPVLFPWLPGSGTLSMEPFLPTLNSKVRGRAEVVQVQDDDLWVLGRGRLQRLQLAWDGQEGPRLAAVWKEPLPLGSPLHASQVDFDRATRHGTLFLVTQALAFRTCLATAVNDDDGAVHWQRQLGLVCQGEPLLLKAAGAEGPPLVLTLDQGGGLFAFDPRRFDTTSGDLFHRGGKPVAAPLPYSPRLPPQLLRSPDGDSAFEFACPGEGHELVIRQVRVDAQRQFTVTERKVKIDQPLAGTPALAGPVIILPLADGNLYKLLWKQSDKGAENGEDWRVGGAAPETLGYVLALGNDRYLATDGAHGLNVIQTSEKTWTVLPKGSDRPTLSRKDRVLAPPFLMPAAGNEPAEICIADAGGVVALLTVNENGSLQVKREWQLKGRLVTGPFLRRLGDAVRLGCVVEQRGGEQRLVWLDPGKQESLWEYSLGTDTLVGQPELCEGLLVLAQESGRYVALDPQTGKAKGPGYVLKGTIAPAASPVSFGPDRLFAPLSDGTVLMLSLKELVR